MSKADQRSSIEKSIAKKQNRLTETRLTHHNLEILNATYLEKVFASVQQKLSCLEEDQKLYLKVNVIIWGINIRVSDTEGSSSSRVGLQ